MEGEGEDSTWVPLANRETLPIWRLICISGSMLAAQVAISLQYTLGTPILMHFGTSQIAISILWSFVPLTGFFVQPLVGYYSDRCLCVWGRRRPFVLVGGIGLVIGVVVMYWAEHIGDVFSRQARQGISVLIFGVDLIWISFFANMVQGPARAILGDCVPQAQQMTANTIGSLVMSAGAMVTNLMGGLGKIPEDWRLSNEQLSIIGGCLLIIIGTIATLVGAREEALFEPVRFHNPFRGVIEAAFNCPRPIFRIAAVYALSWLNFYPFQVIITDFFGTDIYHGSSDPDSGDRMKYDKGVQFGLVVTGVMNGFGCVYTCFQSWLVRRIGIRPMYAASQIVAALCMVLIIFIKNRWALLGIIAPLGFSVAIFNALPFAVVGLIVKNPEQMGVYMGVLNCFAVFGQELGLCFQCSVVANMFPDRAPIIASGAVFAVIATILCLGIIIPATDESNVKNLLGPARADRQMARM
jgi:solute carrier family 45 protein 1/2/4